MERKGFYTSSDYWGWLNGGFQRYPTEAEYNQEIDELERKSESEKKPEVIPA